MKVEPVGPAGREPQFGNGQAQLSPQEAQGDADGDLHAPGPALFAQQGPIEAVLEPGASYYSHEYAVLDPEGRVHPYPRPLSLREGRGRTAAEQLGGGPRLVPLPVGLVLHTRYSSQSRFAPRRISTRAAVLGLMANALSAVVNPELNMRVLPLVAAGALRLSGPAPRPLWSPIACFAA